ncbi:hypothetical protein C8Q76DRAFT_799692 [Earliella scabrosa]|nr:hypothetical protein C8Q76DRAFT_799692 [Earliella scabrosa]
MCASKSLFRASSTSSAIPSSRSTLHSNAWRVRHAEPGSPHIARPTLIFNLQDDPPPVRPHYLLDSAHNMDVVCIVRFLLFLRLSGCVGGILASYAWALRLKSSGPCGSPPTYVRVWLDGDPARQLCFSYCPSHRDVDLNERIDEAVGLAVDDPAVPVPRPCPISLTYGRFTITDDAREDWRLAARGPKYWGRRYPQHPALRAVTHTGNYPVKRIGSSKSLCARMIRCLTDHAPTGAYRLRFFPEQPTHCTCDRPELQTRRHVFDRCTFYPRTPYSLTWDDYLGELDPFPLILDFLETNPSAFTFADAPPTHA